MARHLPTPEELRQDGKIPWQKARIYGAGKIHDLKYKSIGPVLWRKGAGAKLLRLFVIAPLGYRRTKSSRLYYRDPAYLLATDLSSPLSILIQAAFDRWEIEVNHREEKNLMGVGQAQVRSIKIRGPGAAVHGLFVQPSARGVIKGLWAKAHRGLPGPAEMAKG